MLDALVNNAGISPKGPKGERLGVLTSSLEVWRQVFSVNLFSTALLARGLIDNLAGGGAIVNVTSIAGSRVHPYAGSAYACSKAALATLTREMANEFAPRGVRVNAISPGGIFRNQPAEFVQRYTAKTPLGRMATEDDMRGAIAYLSSDLSAYVTGQNLTVDGGWGAW